VHTEEEPIMNATLNDISVVIVTYKGDSLLKDCLDSLAETCGRAPEIIVVDNSPSEATKLIVQTHSNAVYVKSPGNPGFAGGNNRAIPYCTRKYILLLNNDTVIRTAKSILLLANFLEEHKNCGAVQGSGILPMAGNKNAGNGALLLPFGFTWAPGFLDDFCIEHEIPQQCFFGGGFFLMFRKADIKQFGGFVFRSSFWCYYEEADFCHRIWLSGKGVWYLPTPPIDHLLSVTSNKLNKVDIMKKSLENTLFSLNANLSLWSRIKILPFTYLIIFAHAIYQLLRGKYQLFKAEISAIFNSFLCRRRIIAARRQIKRIRKVSDKEIFDATMRMPPLKTLIAKI
jgi:GT2 family glycosyltransferase